MVALARRLARILFAMWRDGVAYDAVRTEPTRAHGGAAIRRRRRCVGWPVVISRGRQAGGVSAMEHVAAVESRPVACATPPSDRIVRRHTLVPHRARIKV